MTTRNPHIGSSFDDYLAEEGILEEVSTIAYARADAWRIEAKLNNALDRRVEPLRDYQGLGRQAWLGVRVDSAGL